MYVEKGRMLYGAQSALNAPNQPWYVTVEGDAVVARWKWTDACFFAPNEVSDETRQFTFTVILDDNGTWREVDRIEQKTTGIGMSGGSLRFGASSQKFIGKTTKKSFEIGMGKNKQTGETGIVKCKFDTEMVKKPIRAYLSCNGWRKTGL